MYTYEDLINEIYSYSKMFDSEDVRDISPIFWNSGDKSNSQKKCHRFIYSKKMEEVKKSIRKRKSVVINTDSFTCRTIGGILRRNMEKDMSGYRVTEYGKLNFTDTLANSINGQVQLVSKHIQRSQVKIDIVFIYNFEMLLNSSLHNDLIYHIRERILDMKTVFVFFYEESSAKIPSLLNPFCEEIRFQGLPGPEALIPIFTENEFKELFEIDNMIDWRDSILKKWKNVMELYYRLNRFHISSIRTIIETREPGKFTFNILINSRNSFLRKDDQSSDLNHRIKVPWLKKEINILRSMLDQNQKNLLKEPKKFKGAILYGPPGNGKTKLIQSMMNDPNYTFIIANSSELRNRYLGDSEKAIRNLFQQAARSSPSVLVFDEMEALFSDRNTEGVRNSTGTQGIIQTLLEEMDGIQSNSDVFIIGMTNRLDQLDSAFRRPGRIDEFIEIACPDSSQIDSICSYFFDLYFDDDTDISVQEKQEIITKMKTFENRTSVAVISSYIKKLSSRVDLNLEDLNLEHYMKQMYKVMPELETGYGSEIIIQREGI